jgi:hypothetical protein
MTWRDTCLVDHPTADGIPLREPLDTGGIDDPIRVTSLAVVVLGVLVSPAGAYDSDEQACINAMNNHLGKLAKIVNKEWRGCLKDYAKAKDVTDVAA